MLAAPIAPLLTLALGAAGSWELGLRAELRGVSGGQPGVGEPAPVELAPSLTFAVEPGDGGARFSASYHPRLLLQSLSEASSQPVATYQSGRVGLSWRPEARTQVQVSASGSWGTLEVSPLTQLPGTAGPSPPPTPDAQSAVQLGGLRSARYFSAAGSTTLEHALSRRLNLGGTFSFSGSGGVGSDLAQTTYPLQWGPFGEAHLAFSVSPRDRLTAFAASRLTVFPNTRQTELVDLVGRWERRLSRRLTGQLAAGTSLAVDHQVAPTRYTTFAPNPRLEAGLTQAAPQRGPAISGVILLRYAPFIDPYGGKVYQRVEGTGQVAWARDRFRVDFSAAAAAALTTGQAGTSLAAGQLGFWRHGREMEYGLIVRGGYQEQVVTAIAPWQWGVSLAVQWAGRRAL